MLISVSLVLIITGCSATGNNSESVTDQELTLTMESGDETGVYTGDLVDGLPHGTGKFTVSNGDEIAWTYEGAWEKGHFEGTGKTVWDDGFIQEGNYQNDLLNGEGKESFEKKLLYEGNYTDNRYDGAGKLYNYHGEVIYEGDFDMGYYQETTEQRKTRLDAFKGQTVESTYAELRENANNETGKKVKITGRVYQVYENYENQQYFCDFLLYYNDNPNQIVQVYYRLNSGEKALVENQTVTVWGTVEYLYTYSTDTGQENTVPNVEAWSVE